MRKIFKIINLNVSLIAVIVSSSLLSACNLVPKLTRDDYVSMLSYNIPGEYEFIAKYETKIMHRASKDSIKNFNDLYDDSSASKTIFWNNFAQLQTQILQEPMGLSHHCELDWQKLFMGINLNSSQTQAVEKQLLRLYNIFAILYGPDLVLKLIQKINLEILNKDVVAQTIYNNVNNNLHMKFGPDFVNTDMIKTQYEQGWWSSNDISTIITHEFASALNFYLGLDDDKRQTFNNNWNWSTTNNKNQPSSVKESIKGTELLIAFLDTKDNITFANEYEKILWPLIVVRSNYGRGYWLKSKTITRSELFSEALAQWLLTPELLRNWNWELLNDFFMNELPKNIKTISLF